MGLKHLQIQMSIVFSALRLTFILFSFFVSLSGPHINLKYWFMEFSIFNCTVQNEIIGNEAFLHISSNLPATSLHRPERAMPDAGLHQLTTPNAVSINNCPHDVIYG